MRSMNSDVKKNKEYILNLKAEDILLSKLYYYIYTEKNIQYNNNNSFFIKEQYVVKFRYVCLLLAPAG